MDLDKKAIFFEFSSASFSGKYEADTEELTAESSVDICLNKIKVLKQTTTSTHPEEDEPSCDFLMDRFKVFWGPQDLTDDNRNKKRRLHIKLKIQEKTASWNVQISGEFLQDLFYICNGQILPSLEIIVGGRAMLGTQGPGASMETKFSCGSSGELKSGKTYWENGGPITHKAVNYVPFIRSIKENNCMATCLVLVIRYTLPQPEEAEEVFPVNKNCLMVKALNDKLFTDVEILALDGGIIPCHKSILAAASPVLATLLQSPMVETQTNQIHFDMEESSVDAFLEYLYSSEIHKPAQNSRIAFDLLEAGHKYDIPGMEISMKAILLGRPAPWFEVDVALKMFMFARNVDSYEQVTTKAVQVIKFHRGKLGTSEEFKDVLKRSPEASAAAII